jgi:vacuolar-type H+-ATPase subunit F/Vma7
MWARKKIRSLVRKGLIEDRKIGGGFHKYHVTDRTNYNLINKMLEQIDMHLVLMQAPLHKIGVLQDGRNPAVAAYTQKLVIPYFDSMFAMLFRLLGIGDTDVNKHDLLKLQTRIITLIAKVTREPFYDLNHTKILSMNKEILKNLKEELSKEGADKTVINIGSIESIVGVINKFEKEFP